jgi:hypothetical protein
MTDAGRFLGPIPGDVVVGAVPVDPAGLTADPAVVWRVRRDKRTLACYATRADALRRGRAIAVDEAVDCWLSDGGELVKAAGYRQSPAGQDPGETVADAANGRTASPGGVPDVGWVRTRVERKQHLRAAGAAPQADTRAASFTALRAELWFEFIVAVTAYNEAVKADEIGVSFSEQGGLHLAKHLYPAGYLDVHLFREPAQFLVAVKLRRSAAAAVVEDVVEGAWTTRDGRPRLLWFGLETTARAVVQRVLTMFIDET